MQLLTATARSLHVTDHEWSGSVLFGHRINGAAGCGRPLSAEAECGRLRRNKYWTWARLLLRRGYHAYKANELNSERITTLSEHLNYEVPRGLGPAVNLHDVICPNNSPGAFTTSDKHLTNASISAP